MNSEFKLCAVIPVYKHGYVIKETIQKILSAPTAEASATARKKARHFEPALHPALQSSIIPLTAESK